MVNDRFKIIILYDKEYINEYNIEFFSQFEILNISSRKLYDKKINIICKSLIDDLEFNCIKDFRGNYSLKNLLINCKKNDILMLIYHLYQESEKYKKEIEDENNAEEKIDENLLKNKAIKKLYNILPQDIICSLPDYNIIKEEYIKSKNINNFKEYINKDKNKKYKISIIYTFTNIYSNIEGLNKEKSFIVSEIRTEKELKNLIEEIKIKNEFNNLKNDNYIYIHFDLHNSKKIEFISYYILNNFKNDEYNYIFIIHINRNFSENFDEKIFS